MTCTPLGPRAALIVFDAEEPAATAARARAIQRHLETAPTEGLVEFSLAFDKVLVEFANPDAARAAPRLAETLSALPPLAAAETRVHEIPVRYDGADLAECAARVGLSIAEFIERHAAPLYHVALLGFSPGFPYLEGLDPRLHLPRRATPRPRIPAGAVAIGGSHAGIYSVPTPGGWNLLGQTEVRLFDPARREPSDEAMFLLRPGDGVRFRPVD